MSDKMVDGLAAVGRARSLFSLIGAIFIAVIFFIVGLISAFKGNYSMGFIMMGVSLLIGGIAYVSHYMVSTNSTYAAMQGAQSIFGSGSSGSSSGSTFSIGPLKIGN